MKIIPLKQSLRDRIIKGKYNKEMLWIGGVLLLGIVFLKSFCNGEHPSAQYNVQITNSHK